MATCFFQTYVIYEPNLHGLDYLLNKSCHKKKIISRNIANTDDPNRKYKDIVEIGDYINFFYIQ